MSVMNIYTFLTCLVIFVIQQTDCIHVDLSEKPFYNLSSETFVGYDARRIDYLYLINCRINQIDENSFENMTELSTLTMSQNNFQSLPEKLFNSTTNIQEIFLYNNKIEQLPKDIFSNLHLLKVLSLEDNNISELDPSIFDNLNNLKSLYISSNNIKVLPRNIFDKLISLNTLWLYNNSISAIDPTTFAHTTQLTDLLISDNKLTELKSGTFSNLLKLDVFDLSANEINHIEIDAFSVRTKRVYLLLNKLQNLAPEVILNLKDITEIRLDDNPWRCDRKFKPLLTTLDKLKSTNKFKIPACVEPPALTGRTWDTLQDADFPAEEYDSVL